MNSWTPRQMVGASLARLALRAARKRREAAALRGDPLAGRKSEHRAEALTIGDWPETWPNPADPHVPPNMRLSMVMSAALAECANRDEALAPLFALNREFGLEFVRRDFRFSDTPESVESGQVAAQRKCAEALAVSFQRGSRFEERRAAILEAIESLTNLLAVHQRERQPQSGEVEVGKLLRKREMA